MVRTLLMSLQLLELLPDHSDLYFLQINYPNSMELYKQHV